MAQYVLREWSRGRPLADVLEDRYVVNRLSEAERARLLERPEVVAAIGKGVLEEMRQMRSVPSARRTDSQRIARHIGQDGTAR